MHPCPRVLCIQVAEISKGIVSCDVGKKIAILTVAGAPEKTAALERGPRGFCTADFGEGPTETEVPNLVLEAKPEPKKSKKTVHKRPAAAVLGGKRKKHKAPEVLMEDADAGAPAEVEDEAERAAGPPAHEDYTEVS